MLEVVATFYDAARAQAYADAASAGKPEPLVEVSVPVLAAAAASNGESAERNGATHELSARQSAVLNALRAKMDENKQVEAKAAESG